MSPCKSIFFLAFALVAAAALQPAAATGEAAGLHAAVNPDRRSIGGLTPLMPILPDPPVRPAPAGPSPSPSPAPAPAPLEPAECMPSLAGLVACLDYLNDYSVRTPMDACCGGFRKVVEEAPICLCHAVNGGDINKMMPEPINIARLMTNLPVACRVPLPAQTLAKCSTEPVPPLSTVPFVPTPP